MNILGTQYSLEAKALEIYVAGCSGNPHCKNCHNPESWDYDSGTDYKKVLASIYDKMFHFSTMIDKFYILGGEPLDQNKEELISLLSELKNIHKKPIWLFTRYEINEIDKDVKELCSYIKCGRYVEELKTNHNMYGVTLSSSNQYIIKT